MANLEAPPLSTALVTTKDGMITGKWFDWLTLRLLATVNASPAVLKALSLTNQNDAIGSTPIPLPALASGTYRLTYYLKVTTADGVSSSVTLTLGWTDGGNACSVSGAALTGDALTSAQSGSVMIQLDQATALTYSTAYASNTPNKMKYKLLIVVEKIA